MYGHHGDIDGPNDAWDFCGGAYDGCRLFDNDTAIIVPTGVLSHIDNKIGITVWVNGKLGQTPDKDMTIFDGGDPCREGEFKLTAAVPDEMGNVLWRAGNDSNDVLVWEEPAPEFWQGEWRRLTFIKNEIAGLMSIYFHGRLVSSKADVDDGTLGNIRNKPFKIGAYNYHANDYEGKLDDFRLYNIDLYPPPPLNPYASHPSPYDNETDIALNVVLSWQPGYCVQDVNGHDVYFGTDFYGVYDANTSSPEYRGSRNRDANTYIPGILDPYTTYYWRIDEVNDACEPNSWKGRVWRFSTGEYLVVDDFESYDFETNWIFDTWLDSWAWPPVNNSGSEVWLGLDPAEPVRGGRQSMMYIYDNRDSHGVGLDYYSESEREYADPLNCTEAGMKILTLFFYGNQENDANDTEQMYVRLKDTGENEARICYGDYGEDMNDIRVAEWRQWDIGLPDFAGVDASNINKICIGFGDISNQIPGGRGIVYFDDIRLYRPGCFPERARPYADLSGNCTVDFADVQIMADYWLETDHAAESPANLCTDEPAGEQVVNFRDYAVLIDSWLEKKFWPE